MIAITHIERIFQQIREMPRTQGRHHEQAKAGTQTGFFRDNSGDLRGGRTHPAKMKRKSRNEEK